MKGIESRERRSRSRGFTLLELVIAVAVLAILTAIAYPSYEEYLLKSRRRAAEACLMELAQWMERHYTLNMRYDKDASGNDVTLPLLDCRTELKDLSNGEDPGAYYEFRFVNIEPDEFKIEAVPSGPQARERCGTLSVDHLGRKSATGSGQDCW